MKFRTLDTLPLTALCLLAACGISACHSDSGHIDPIPIDGNVTPTLVTYDVNTYISDSGYTRYHLTADQWLMFEEADEPNWKFPDGLFLEKFDKDMLQEATIVSDSAIYFSQKKLWRLDGNVRMRNTAGDRFLTQQLFWNQNEHKVYSDSFIHIDRADRTIEGYGFESNEQMTTYTITRPTGIFPVSDFRKQAADSTGSQAPDTITPAVQSADSTRRRQSKPRRLEPKTDSSTKVSDHS